MNTLYSTKVTATGGRHGQIRSEDGLLEMKLALPRQLGGKGDATNPETLLAGGYAAFFEDALIHVRRDAGVRSEDEDVERVAEVALSRNVSGGFVLSVALAITVAGVDQKRAEELVESADKICPYSNAIRGNVDVRITVSAHCARSDQNSDLGSYYYVQQHQKCLRGSPRLPRPRRCRYNRAGGPSQKH